MLNFQILISEIGDIKIMILLVLVVSTVLYFLKNKRDSFIVLFSSGLAVLITYTLKNILKIPRPENMLIVETGYRFPSGHATMSAVVMSLIVYFSFKYVKNNCLKYFISILGVMWCILIMNSRLYLGVHIPIDLIFGVGVGIFSTLFIIKKRGIVFIKS